MKLIIVSGPSGSGKTTLSKKILKKLKDGIILNTDNYYRIGILSQILSKIIPSYFDRRISFNSKKYKRHLEFILRNRFTTLSYKYNFKTRSINKKLKNTKNINFVIVEGIFGKEVLNFYPKNHCIFINLKTDKEKCKKRVIKRDFKERAKSKTLAKEDFRKAWKLFDKNKKKDKTINYLKKFNVRNKSDIKILLKKLIKIMN